MKARRSACTAKVHCSHRAASPSIATLGNSKFVLWRSWFSTRRFGSVTYVQQKIIFRPIQKSSVATVRAHRRVANEGQLDRLKFETRTVRRAPDCPLSSTIEDHRVLGMRIQPMYFLQFPRFAKAWRVRANLNTWNIRIVNSPRNRKTAEFSAELSGLTLSVHNRRE
jgi:hypothetical protein